MSWYVHPSRQLRDDELPPELVVTNRDGSIEQVYVPYDATGEQLKAENARLRELAGRAWKTAERLCQAFDGPCSADDVTSYDPCQMGERDEECVYGQLQRELRECGVEVDG